MYMMCIKPSLINS